MDQITKRVAADYRARQVPDVWLSVADVAAVCPSCASRMAGLGIRRVRASVVFGDALAAHNARTADKWKKLPEGWTSKSLKKFWQSLTGNAKHKVTACIEKMEGKIGDPGAFCAAARDRIEGTTAWRGER